MAHAGPRKKAKLGLRPFYTASSGLTMPFRDDRSQNATQKKSGPPFPESRSCSSNRIRS
ncbi:hypothetical protein EM6_0162 [Asticcacaulis excentricus]|uniref:Uncharacterized protein n=1 Tax=Asticcacaulis excentricus TaxID=78587 RepID=A0A3G9G3G1_9CAUL|nr:hypothetical protein EM6_0162 [Asticcacaulis excentricus]